MFFFKILSILYLPEPLIIKVKQISAYIKASSEKSPSNQCFNDATIMVKNSKEDENLVKNPTIINIAPMDSAKDAMNPKNIFSDSKPIKSVNALPSLSHLMVPAEILYIP